MGPFLEKLRISIRVEDGVRLNPLTSNRILPHLLSLLEIVRQGWENLSASVSEAMVVDQVEHSSEFLSPSVK